MTTPTTTAAPGDTVIGTVRVERPITIEMAESIIQTAIEGGIGYWSYAEDIVHETVPESIDSIGWRYQSYVLDIENIGEGVEFPAEVRTTPYQARVDYQTAVTGLQRLLAKRMVNDEIMGYIYSALAENDPGHIDATAADCIVQAGLFGEVVYG